MDAKQIHQESVGQRSPQFRADIAAPRSALADTTRVIELDGLRGLAAVTIVFFHWSPQRLPGGWAAVDLFFVLSGYLITAIILRNGDRPGFLKTFYFRRGLRIWPIYYLTVLAVACLRIVLPQRIRWAGLPYTLTYTQFAAKHVFRDLPDFSPLLWHTWTLAIEEQFYLLWPLLLLGLGRRRLIPIAAACVVAAVVGRAGGWNWIILGARCDALALGGLLAALLAEPATGTRRSALRGSFATVVLACLAALVPIATRVGLNLPVGPPRWPGLTLLAINGLWFGLVGLVVLYSGMPIVRFLRARPLAYLGRISYGLYLYHFVFLMLTNEIIRANAWRADAVWTKAPAVAASFLVAVLSWKYVERPILRWRDRYDYQESSSPVSRHATPTAGLAHRTHASS